MEIEFKNLPLIMAEILNEYAQNCEGTDQKYIRSVTIIIHGEDVSCVAGAGFVDENAKGEAVLDSEEGYNICRLLINKFDQLSGQLPEEKPMVH